MDGAVNASSEMRKKTYKETPKGGGEEHRKCSNSLTLVMQAGVAREIVTVPASKMDLYLLKQIACNFVLKKNPEHGLNRLRERLLLFRHVSDNGNTLVPVNNPSDVTEGALLEVVISAQSPGDEIQLRPHSLTPVSYRLPSFCDYCGGMLYGLVRQGLRCNGCRLNFHKRCAHLIPNNCSRVQQPLSITASGDDDRNTEVCEETAIAPAAGSKQAPSWPTGRPAWLERELAGRICAPHAFVVHSYKFPTICLHCKRLLKGIYRQGLQCTQCKFNVHRRCVDKATADCEGDVARKWSDACRQRGHEELEE